MAKYRFTETAYSDGRIYKEGETVTVSNSVIPGPHMTPLDEDAKTAAKSANMVKTDLLGE